MRLINPNLGDAVTAVLRVQSELNNASNSHGASERADGFLSWCNSWARPQLGNYLAKTEDIFADLDVSYDRIALAPQMTDRRLNGLINHEVQTWDRRLESLQAELRGLAAFLLRPGRVAVLDTSVLMEGPPFGTFDWQRLDPASAGQPVRLIVPILVIEELDDLKHDRDGGRRKRARETFRALWDLNGSKPTEAVPLPDMPEVTIEVMLDGDWHQRRPNNDAEIIDQAAAIRELTGRDVLLVSCDGSMLYRAAAVGLVPMSMPRRDET